MTVTRDEAKAALHDVDSARRHSLTLFQYGLASPYLLLWGVLWVVAGVICAISPDNAGAGWLAVDAIGIAATGYLVFRDARRYAEGEAAQGLRYAATVVVLGVFIAMTFMVFAPVSGLEIQIFITLLVATIYMVAGVWFGLRYFVVGGILAALAAGVLHFPPAYASLVVSVLGGGALILGGLWMRRAR